MDLALWVFAAIGWVVLVLLLARVMAAGLGSLDEPPLSYRMGRGRLDASGAAGAAGRRLAGWLAVMSRPVYRAYLRKRIEHCEQAAQIHEWHAKREPQLKRIAEARAAELRAKLAQL